MKVFHRFGKSCGCRLQGLCLWNFRNPFIDLAVGGESEVKERLDYSPPRKGVLCNRRRPRGWGKDWKIERCLETRRFWREVMNSGFVTPCLGQEMMGVFLVTTRWWEEVGDDRQFCDHVIRKERNKFLVTVSSNFSIRFKSVVPTNGISLQDINKIIQVRSANKNSTKRPTLHTYLHPRYNRWHLQVAEEKIHPYNLCKPCRKMASFPIYTTDRQLRAFTITIAHGVIYTSVKMAATSPPGYPNWGETVDGRIISGSLTLHGD
jgi:hypothetical protein